MEQMLAGKWYRIDDSDTGYREAWERSKAACARYSQEGPFKGPEGRRAMLTEMLGSVGTKADINPPFHCAFGFNIHLGEGAFLNFNCVILDDARVEIGDHTFIGPAAQICTVDHPREPAQRLEKWLKAAPVKIGKNVWIGGGALILPGLTIGDNAIIGAGSVVTRDVAEGCTVVGSPARPINSSNAK